DLGDGACRLAERAWLDEDVLCEEVAVAELDVVVAERRAVERRPLLEHDHLIASAGENPRRDAAAGAGADDEDLAFGQCHVTLSETDRRAAARSSPDRGLARLH